MLTRVLYGGRLSLLAGFVPTLVAGVIGTIIGTWAGLVRERVGAISCGLWICFMRSRRFCWQSPSAPSLGPGLTNTIIAVSIVFIPPVSRIAESETRRSSRRNTSRPQAVGRESDTHSA